MSCENEKDVRIINKYSTFPGVEPTIPNSGDHQDGTWLPTDLYIGELFFNISDNKAWYRSASGIVPLSGSFSGTSSFIGDYVHISGGTYSGPVFAPTFSSNGIQSTTIIGDYIIGGTFTGGVFYGDGSGLTGINANWNGGIVSNPTEFQDMVYADTGLYVDNIFPLVGGPIQINSNVDITGSVTATQFIGDGSLLTNLPGMTGSDNYTISATLSGNEIVFSTVDQGDAYRVDLTPILSTYSVTNMYWNSTLNVLEFVWNNGDTSFVEITTFNTLAANVVTGDTFYGGDFFGSFNGTFSGYFSDDIFTSSAALVGTELVFDRTNGTTYSVDLSPISATGSGSGSVGPTGPAGATGANGLRSIMNLSYTGSSLTLGTGSITLPITTPINNLGWQQGTRLRVWNDATHYMEGQITSTIANPQASDINVNIDYVVGSGSFGAWYVGIAGDIGSDGTSGATPSLSQVLLVGNNNGASDIAMTPGTQIWTEASGGEYGRLDFDPSMMRLETSFGPSNFVSSTVDVYADTIEIGVFVNDPDPASNSDAQITLNTSSILSEARIDTQSTSIQQDEVSITITNPNTTTPGVQYFADYSANYTLRTLVDKEYVDNAVAGGGTGITYSGLSDYLTYFNADDSLSYNDIHYNGGQYTIGWGYSWEYEDYAKFGIYSPYSLNPALTVEGSQFGAIILARGSNTGQNVGLQVDSTNSTFSGNLGMNIRSFGTQSANVGVGISVYDGYQTSGAPSNQGLEIGVSGVNSVAPSGITNSGINILVSGRVGDYNYIGQLRDGSEGLGKVLTSDANGWATWQTPTGGGGGATPSLAQVLITGNTASTDIDMNQNQLTNVSVIDADGNVGIQTINMINASLLTLMYNT